MADDFLLRAAIEWAKVAARLRGQNARGEEGLRAAALRLPREAAWCHLLLASGRPAAVMVRLRSLAPDARLPTTGNVCVDAGAILAHLRHAVDARFPT